MAVLLREETLVHGSRTSWKPQVERTAPVRVISGNRHLPAATLVRER